MFFDDESRNKPGSDIKLTKQSFLIYRGSYILKIIGEICKVAKFKPSSSIILQSEKYVNLYLPLACPEVLLFVQWLASFTAFWVLPQEPLMVQNVS